MRFIFVLALLLGPSAAFSENPVCVLLDKIKATKDIAKKVEYYQALGRHYQYHQPDSAIFYTRKGLEISRQGNYRLGEAMLIGELGTLNEKHDNLELARKYALESLEIYQQLKHLQGIASEYNGLGIIEGKRGNYKAATNYFISSLRLNEKLKNTAGIVQSYIKLGVVNERSGNLDKALEYYVKARELNADDPAALYTILNNIGVVEAKRGDLKKALSYFQQGASLSDTPAYAPMHLNLAMNAGNALKELGQKKEALAQFTTVLQKTRLYRLPEIEARTLLNLSEFDQTKSRAHLNDALEIAQRIGNKELQSEVFQALADLNKQEGKYQASLEALEHYYALRDSIYDMAKSREIASLQASYELEKSKERVQNLELANQKRTAERNGGIVIIALILFMLGGLWFYLKKVQKWNLKLQESNSVKDKLFSIIGHDLRSPMSSSIQMFELMESGLLSEEETREMVKALRNHSQASLDTLDSLLLWGKGQLQGVKVNQTVFDPKPVLQKNFAFFQQQAEQKLVRMEDLVPEHLKLFADKDQFDFVLRNLISNAIKFSYPSGRITISASSRDKPGFVVFSVKDEGKGIEKDLIDQLFQPMMDCSSGTAGEKGTGLGLMLCKEFLNANGGEIWINTEPNKGAELFFSIPFAGEAPPIDQQQCLEAEATG